MYNTFITWRISSTRGITRDCFFILSSAKINCSYTQSVVMKIIIINQKHFSLCARTKVTMHQHKKWFDMHRQGNKLNTIHAYLYTNIVCESPKNDKDSVNLSFFCIVVCFCGFRWRNHQEWPKDYYTSSWSAAHPVVQAVWSVCAWLKMRVGKYGLEDVGRKKFLKTQRVST